MYQFEVSLQYTVLARCSVYCDIGIVEHHEFPVLLEREVVAVYWCPCAVVEVDIPRESSHVNNPHVVTFFVEKRVKSLCRAHRNVVL